MSLLFYDVHLLESVLFAVVGKHVVYKHSLDGIIPLLRLACEPCAHHIHTQNHRGYDVASQLTIIFVRADERERLRCTRRVWATEQKRGAPSEYGMGVDRPAVLGDGAGELIDYVLFMINLSSVTLGRQ